MDSVPAFYGGGGVSYNFLHLTLQEFLVAYHITQLSNGAGLDIFNHHCKDERWEVVWRFASGLTGFQFFIESVMCDAFAFVVEGEYLRVSDLLLHCLLEGQFIFDYMASLGKNHIFSVQHDSSPLDRYALGYCIANCSSTTSWKVQMWYGSGESFMWGLNSNHCGNGVIQLSHLKMHDVHPTCLDSYPPTILPFTKYFDLMAPDHDTLQSLVKVFPMMKNLASLYLELPNLTVAPKLLGVISRTNVTALTLTYYCMYEHLSDQTFLSSLKSLIDSPSKKLRYLAIEPPIVNTTVGVSTKSLSGITTKPLCDVLFGQSSLNQLSLELLHFTENSFELLQTNTCLTTVHISSDSEHTLDVQPLSRILQNNKTIEILRWGECKKPDLEQVETLNVALSSNTALKKLILDIDTSYISPDLSSLISDNQVKLNSLYSFDDEVSSDIDVSSEASDFIDTI